MIIYPDGAIDDIYLDTPPLTGQRIIIKGKAYYVKEAHESMVEKWAYVATLVR